MTNDRCISERKSGRTDMPHPIYTKTSMNQAPTTPSMVHYILLNIEQSQMIEEHWTSCQLFWKTQKEKPMEEGPFVTD